MLLEDLLESQRIKCIKWLQYQKNVYIDKLADIVNKYNNTYRNIKMKPVDVKPSTYIDFNKENNKDFPTFKVVDHVKPSFCQ